MQVIGNGKKQKWQKCFIINALYVVTYQSVKTSQRRINVGLIANKEKSSLVT